MEHTIPHTLLPTHGPLPWATVGMKRMREDGGASVSISPSAMMTMEWSGGTSSSSGASLSVSSSDYSSDSEGGSSGRESREGSGVWSGPLAQARHRSQRASHPHPFQHQWSSWARNGDRQPSLDSGHGRASHDAAGSISSLGSEEREEDADGERDAPAPSHLLPAISFESAMHPMQRHEEFVLPPPSELLRRAEQPPPALAFPNVRGDGAGAGVGASASPLGALRPSSDVSGASSLSVMSAATAAAVSNAAGAAAPRSQEPVPRARGYGSRKLRKFSREEDTSLPALEWRTIPCIRVQITIDEDGRVVPLDRARGHVIFECPVPGCEARLDSFPAWEQTPKRGLRLATSSSQFLRKFTNHCDHIYKCSHCSSDQRHIAFVVNYEERLRGHDATVCCHFFSCSWCEQDERSLIQGDRERVGTSAKGVRKHLISHGIPNKLVQEEIIDNMDAAYTSQIISSLGFLTG